MNCKKWSSGKERILYNNCCMEAIINEEIFNNLKNDVRYRMVEKPEYKYKECGEWLLNVFIRNYPDKLHLLEFGIENDKFLNPVCFDYTDILKSHVKLSTYNLSFCCISYTIKALNIFKHIHNKSLEELNIVEIGGGYGGQAFLIIKIGKELGYNINTYSIYDLEYPSKIQNKYIKLTELDKLCSIMSFYNFTDTSERVSKYNFLVSNYAFSEISTEIQNEYIKNILGNVNHGFLLWNFLNRERVNSYFLNIPGIILNEREECNPDVASNSLEIKY